MRDMPVMRTAAAIALACSAACTPFAAQADAPFSFETTPGKLPKDVVPLEYHAHLVPDFAANTFRGAQKVDIEVRKATSTIMLNADNMEIEAASLSGMGMPTQKLTPILDSKQQTLRFELAQPLAPGVYKLALKFRGQINRDGRGLFSVDYKAGGADKRMIATILQPTEARRMLPTWDEPSFRARFRLTVDVPAGYKAFSNTPVEKQEQIAGGKQRFSFGVTPKMPSYLVSVVAGELERVSVKEKGVDIGVVTTAGKTGSAGFTLAASRDLLHYYNNYFGTPYPLPKLDHIALPGSGGGAMENWGAIVYNEASILSDPQTSPESVKKVNFHANAHAFAHQWFGNLVTMAWWDNLWLNEGFAAWMENKAMQHFHPEWRPYLDAISDREIVLNQDAHKTTHPIQVQVENEQQAAAAFDSITYRKSRAFVQMLEAYLGEEKFRKGVRTYLARHQYSNTTPADLWQALEQASGKPVAKLASDWTMQPGYPLIKVEQSCEDGKRRVTLSQEQFRLDEPASVQRLWNVPVKVGTVGGNAWYTLLSGPSSTITQASCEGTLVVDPYSVGYFRVQYDPASFQALVAQAPRLQDTTRLKLLNDSWTLVSSGRMQLDAYLDLVAQYRKDPRLAVWDAMLANLRTLERYAAGQPEQARISRFIIDFARPRFAALGWEPKPEDTTEDVQLRALLAAELARAGDAQVIAEGRARFARYLEDPSSVSPSMIDFVIGVAARYADAATYEILAERARSTASSEERQRLLRALATVKDPALAERSLKAALSPTVTRPLAQAIVQGVAAEHPDLAWNFAIAHRDEFLQSVNALSRHRAFANILAASANPAHADTLEAYMRKNFGPDAMVEAERVGNGVRIRAAQKARLLPQVRAALK